MTRDPRGIADSLFRQPSVSAAAASSTTVDQPVADW
jgi:hypothetical protein